MDRPQTDDSLDGSDPTDSGEQQPPIRVSVGNPQQMLPIPPVNAGPMMFAIPGGYGIPSHPYLPRFMSPMVPLMYPPMSDPRLGPQMPQPLPGPLLSVVPSMMPMPPMVQQPYGVSMVPPYVLAPGPAVMPPPSAPGYMAYSLPPPPRPQPTATAKAPSAELMPVSLHAPEVAHGKNPLPTEYEVVTLDSICKEHLSRGCRHGAECQFIHLPEGYRPFPDQVCRDYVRGGASFCKRRKCRFFHGDASELQLAVDEVTNSQHPREAVFVRHAGAAGTSSPMELVILFQRIPPH